MGMRIWRQSFTVLGRLPAYAAALGEHFRKVARADTEVVLHGQQFVLGGLAAEEQGVRGQRVLTLWLASGQRARGRLAAGSTEVWTPTTGGLIFLSLIA